MTNGNNISVRDFFKQFSKDTTLYYCSNPGNAGDALIALGSFHLFDDLGLDIKFIDQNNFDAKDKVVIYAGGGNFNHLYQDARSFLLKHHKDAGQLIILPHTITENQDLISEFGDNVTVFTRENVSYEHVKEHAALCRVYLDHDMAFHLDRARVDGLHMPSLPSSISIKLLKKIKRIECNDDIPSISKMIEILIFELISKWKDKHVGIFFRDDVEAAGRDVPSANSDLSKIYELSTRSRQIIEYTVWLLMMYIDQFESVNTDRLHICVAASFLGKPVNFYGNSYFKCRAVYEYSLKDRYRSITWHG